MDDLSKKNEHYQKLVDDLGAGDDSISHAVLITAHPREAILDKKRYEVHIAADKADRYQIIEMMSEAIRILKAEIEKEREDIKH